MALSHNPTIVKNGLVLLLDVADISSYPGSGTTVFDLSGNGNNGTLTNGPLVVAQNQGAVTVDGSNDYITVAGMPTGTEWTIQIWSFIDGPTVFTVAGHRTYACTDNFRFQWDDKSTNIAHAPFADFVSPGSNITGFTNKSELDIFNKWNQVTMTSDGATTRVYWNDTISPASMAQRVFSTNGNMQIGINGLSGIGGADIFNRDGGDCYFGPVTVYNRALSPAEVVQNYQAQKSRFGL
jgi:hypothetical protein